MWQGTERFGHTVTTPRAHEQAGHWNWVYRRRGHACLVCGTPVEMVRQGELQRTTYFCPRCQPARETTAAVAQPERVGAGPRREQERDAPRPAAGFVQRLAYTANHGKHPFGRQGCARRSAVGPRRDST